MNNNYSSQQVCLHCMSGYVVAGRCRRCGKPNADEGRSPVALPFGYVLLTPRQRGYQLGRVLGDGGFGITYLAWDLQARRPVAVKELFPNRFSRKQSSFSIELAPADSTMFSHFRKRFVDEARIISSFHNEPEIIDIYDYFEANGTGYYVMEYLYGMDMQHWIKQKNAPLSWRYLENPIKQILHSLIILHGHGFIHRDISPDNIFICQDGKTKLIDFGSVRNQNADHFTTVLKRGYAPPEQFISEGNQGPWTDTFSLCATMYYLLSNVHPVPVYDRLASIDSKKTDPLVPLDHYKPEAPEHVIQAIMHGLNLDETQRFRSVEAMQNALFPETQEVRHASNCYLKCVNGLFAGKSFPVVVGHNMSIGRGEANLISYPLNTPGVSREQCFVHFQADGRLYIKDRKSKYGTYIGRRRIPPMEWVEVPRGAPIIFGRERFVFIAP